MLRGECARFRERFRPGRSEPRGEHRLRCPACEAFAAELEALLPKAEPEALPPELRGRLVAIAAAETTPCPTEDELYRLAKAQAQAGDRLVEEGVETATAMHLEGCASCAAAVSALAAFLASAEIRSEELPEPLAERLRGVATPRFRAALPWLADVRVAVLASYLLAVGWMLLPGDSQALLRGASEVRSGASVLIRKSEERVVAVGELAGSTLGTGGERWMGLWENAVEATRRVGEVLVPERFQEILGEAWDRVWDLEASVSEQSNERGNGGGPTSHGDGSVMDSSEMSPKPSSMDLQGDKHEQ